LDLEAGGTWLGLNERGVFVGLTNLRPDAVGKQPLEASALARSDLRSRGDVVMAALEAHSADRAAGVLAELEEEAYNPFQLLVADEREAWLTIYRDRPRTVALEAGVHIVGNVEGAGHVEGGRVDATGSEESAPATSEEPRALKVTRVRQRVEKMMTESGEDLFEGLARICREHVGEAGSQEPGKSVELGDECTENLLESTCVHVGDRYGTRSSLLLELSLECEASRLWTTEGPPCEQPYEDLSPLLRALDVRSGPAAEAEHEARTNR
jgi:uncharacterized protein with NRDE domain